MADALTAKMWVGAGQLIDPFTFTADMMEPTEIGRALSRINRFGGNGLFPYSVAQHSTSLSYMVPPHLAKAALLHDVVEIFLGDIPNPVKMLCPQIQEIEEVLIKQVAKAYGVPYSEFLEIKPFDSRIGRDEAKALFPEAIISDDQRLGIEVRFQPADDAAMDWAYRFWDLFLGEVDNG